MFIYYMVKLTIHRQESQSTCLIGTYLYYLGKSFPESMSIHLVARYCIRRSKLLKITVIHV